MTPARFKIAWLVILAALFVWFSAWYGGNSKPISEDEGRALIERLHDTFGDNVDNGRGFIANLETMIPNDDGREFYAVNLENLKEGPEAEHGDREYAKIVFPQLLKRGGHPVFISKRVGLMLGQYGNQVDRVAVVRYRSLRDMIDMVLDPSMEAGEVHKFAALDHTEVFITRPTITFIHVRITLALLLILIGWLGLRGIDRIANRRPEPEGA